jgi:sulfur carrier protein
MKLSINGEIKEFKEKSLTIKEILDLMQYNKGIAVALNETFILKTEYENIEVKDGDRLDILSPIQGG